MREGNRLHGQHSIGPVAPAAKKIGGCTSKQQADQNKATNKSNVDLTLLPGLNRYSSLLSIMDSDQGPGAEEASEGRRSWGDRGRGSLKLGCSENEALISNCERQLSQSSWIGFLLFKRIASPRSRRFGRFKCIDPRRGEKVCSQVVNPVTLISRGFSSGSLALTTKLGFCIWCLHCFYNEE